MKSESEVELNAIDGGERSRRVAEEVLPLPAEEEEAEFMALHLKTNIYIYIYIYK